MSNVRDVKENKGGTATLSLGGEMRRLKFDLNSFAELEELFGGVEDAMKALDKGSIKALRAIVWAGLLHDNMDERGNATLSLKEVGAWIDIKDLPHFSEKLGKALAEALPQEEKGQGRGKVGKAPEVPFDQETQEQK